ncbi:MULTISPECIES: hypothetical protein [Vibrio]|uniref:hypothetical protein n=1 Tax=Vibrio TaxID=662 RepID=UPI001BD3BEAE|nr:MULTISPECIES: hypothetical protein [Vibrio]MBS9824528.1 hypothetical protein [Vibrio alginolyticus]MDW1660148.1 hypothetical protein [Vibrio sp. Vb2658]
MSSVLLDNATISSVQRALGKAPTKEPALLDIEHVALERFSESFLLSDKIIVPDTYKQALTPARKKMLSDPVFDFVTVEEQEDTDLLTIANSLSEAWTTAYKEGSDRELFSQYFEQANAFSNFIWEHASSEFYLVFRSLGIDKENPLIEAVLASPADYGLGEKYKIKGTDGQPVDWEKLSSHVKRMLSVMAWLGTQYIWHQVYAAKHGVNYMSHPLRDFFSYDFLDRLNHGSNSSSDFAKAFRVGMRGFQKKMLETYSDLDLVQSSDDFRLPNFIPMLVKECATGQEYLEALSHYRKTSEVVEIRERLSAIEEEMQKGSYQKHTKMVREIEAVGDNLLKQKGVDPRFIKLAPPTKMLGISVSGDDAKIELPIPAALYNQYFVGKRYRSFVKKVMNELSMPSQYGALKDRLNSYAWIKKESMPKFYLKQEEMPSLFHKPFTKSSL